MFRWWPFKKSAAETEGEATFKKMIAESRTRTDDLEAVAKKLKANQEKIHQRAQQLLGEEDVVAARQALKSSPG